jgi:hypothetical protein
LRPDEQPAAVERVRERSAHQCERDERDQLDERERGDRERGAGQVVDLKRQRDLDDPRAEILRGLAEPEPAECRVLAQRGKVDRKPGEAPAGVAGALEAR